VPAPTGSSAMCRKIGELRNSHLSGRRHPPPPLGGVAYTTAQPCNFGCSAPPSSRWVGQSGPVEIRDSGLGLGGAQPVEGRERPRWSLA
jgi:hypothetical protein